MDLHTMREVDWVLLSMLSMILYYVDSGQRRWVWMVFAFIEIGMAFLINITRHL